jgi:hypothetical protein
VNQHIRDQIRRDFETEYRAPTVDLTQMLRPSGHIQRHRGATLGRAGAVIAVAAVVALAVTLPRIVSPIPNPATGSGCSKVSPSRGYRITGSAQPLSTHGGQELGVVPAGHAFGVIVQRACTSQALPAVIFAPSPRLGSVQLMPYFPSSHGKVQLLYTAPTASVRNCQVGGDPVGGGPTPAATYPARPTVNLVCSVIVPGGVPFRVTLEVSIRPGTPSKLPQ